MPKVSIITVARLRPQLLVQAIASLNAQSSQDFEWIVIWAKELEWIVDRQEFYPYLNKNDILTLDRLKDKYLSRHQENQQLEAFADRSKMLK